jgi:hypothetical protein
MIRQLTPASHRSPFHASAINLAGLLLCVFTTLAVLINVSRDQSGTELSEVTAAFRGSLRDHGREDFAVIAAGFRHEADAANEKLADKSGISGLVSRQKLLRGATLTVSEEEASGQFTTEKPLPVDVNGPVFSHLMTELERFCNISRSVEFGGQLALDLQSQSLQSDSAVRDAIQRILKTCVEAKVLTHEQPAELEIVVWASTPDSDALAHATDNAFDLEQSLEKSLKANSSGPILLSSSGRIWTRSTSPRPLTTIFIRTAKH